MYTLDPPRGSGDPLIGFLLRSKAGHCEYFASAAAMMLASRGIRARLVTGSYGGETGAFSDAIVVRGANLHAWVEADLDGTGFQVIDPTPPSGIPPATARVSWWKRLVTVGRSIEVFYDRRILGFDAGDQIQLTEAFRDSFGNAAAVDFRGASRLFFLSDGTFVDLQGNPLNGSIFLGIPKHPETARAVTILGATGRVRAYRWTGSQWIQ